MGNLPEEYQILLEKMPKELREKTQKELLEAENIKERMRIMRNANKKRRFTAKREEIPWHPTVDSEKCVGCKICFSFCPMAVYDWQEKNQKVQVASPSKCVFLCKGCLSKCPNQAISFPERREFAKYFYYVGE